MNPVSKFRTFRVNPTVDTAIYAANDMLGPIVKLAKLFEGDGGFAKLTSLVVVDQSKNKPQIDFMFWNQLPVIASADNAAFDLTDAEAVKLAGRTQVVTANYLDSASNSLGYVGGLALLMKAIKSNANEFGRDLWFNMVVSAGTPTFAATALNIELEFEIY